MVCQSLVQTRPVPVFKDLRVFEERQVSTIMGAVLPSTPPREALWGWSHLT